VNGSVTKVPDLPQYDSNTVVTLTPVPDAGYHFTSWSGDLTGSGNPDSIVMDGSKSVTAGFALDLPSAPVLVSPSDNAVILVDSVVFIWNGSTPAVDTYAVEIATDSLMSTIVSVDTLADTAQTRKGLASGISYWWRVRAHNLSGWGEWSDTLKFTLASTAVSLPKSYSLNLYGVSGARSIIKYALPAPSLVSIRIYSIQGKLIKTLVESRQAAGYYRIPSNLSALSKGFYILSFHAGSCVIRKKLVNF
ncbi:MAG: T9SS type A sorting domain-containing protein, partial [Chitinispirillaceae bacterium]|nr:T9SS type A sorting domain-containing protein [Chitinispirillaceae bacterium]